MNGTIEFDWDAENIRHLRRHHVSAREFEELLSGDSLDLEYRNEAGEERYKVLGATKAGRILIGVWTPREGRIRAVTAYSANRAFQRLYWESLS